MTFIIKLSLIFSFLLKLRIGSNRQLFRHLFKNYSETIIKTVRNFEKSKFKIGKLKLDHEFLSCSQSNKILPNFLQFKLPNRNLRSDQHTDFRFSLLDAELMLKSKGINDTNKSLMNSKHFLKNNLFFLDYYCVLNYISRQTLLHFPILNFSKFRTVFIIVSL